MSQRSLSLSVAAVLVGGIATADSPQVAVDISPVHSLVAQVMEGIGTPDLIIQPGASPHHYNLRPSEATALQNADLVVWMGEDLAPWLADAVATLAAEAQVIELLEADNTILLEFRESALFEAHDHDAHEDGHDEHGHDDHAGHGHDDKHKDHGDGHKDAHAATDDGHDHDAHKGHEHGEHESHGHDDHKSHEHGHDDHAGHGYEDHAHGQYDPHAWLSPDNARFWLNLIAGQLSALDPENAGTYFANATAARAELDMLADEINQILGPARGGKFVVFHDAYQYFEAAFNFPASGAISLGDASQPSAARVAEIQKRVRDESIRCVLSEPQFNPRLVATVLEGTPANTGVIDPLGADLEPGPDLYAQLIRDIATALVGCL